MDPNENWQRQRREKEKPHRHAMRTSLNNKTMSSIAVRKLINNLDFGVSLVTERHRQQQQYKRIGTIDHYPESGSSPLRMEEIKAPSFSRRRVA